MQDHSMQDRMTFLVELSTVERGDPTNRRYGAELAGISDSLALHKKVRRVSPDNDSDLACRSDP